MRDGIHLRKQYHRRALGGYALRLNRVHMSLQQSPVVNFAIKGRSNRTQILFKDVKLKKKWSDLEKNSNFGIGNLQRKMRNVIYQSLEMKASYS